MESADWACRARATSAPGPAHRACRRLSAAAAPPPRQSGPRFPRPSLAPAPRSRAAGLGAVPAGRGRRRAGGSSGENNEAALRTGAGQVAGLEPHQSRGAAAPGRRLSGGAESHAPRARVEARPEALGARRGAGSAALGSLRGPTLRRPGSRRRLRAWAPRPHAFRSRRCPARPAALWPPAPVLDGGSGASGAAGGAAGPRLCPHGAPALLKDLSRFTRDKTLAPPAAFASVEAGPSSCPTPRVQHTPQHRHFLQEMETLGSAVKAIPGRRGADRGQWLL